MTAVVAGGATRSLTSADIDLSTVSGIQALLSIIRQTALDREEYAELRDLILDYKHSDGDVGIKETILGLLEVYGIITESDDVVPAESPASFAPKMQTTQATPVAPSMTEPPVSVVKTPPAQSEVTQSGTPQRASATTGISRPQPQFGASAKPKQEKVAQVPVQSVEEQIVNAAAEVVPPTPSTPVVPKEQPAPLTPPVTQATSSQEPVVANTPAPTTPAPVAPATETPTPTPPVSAVTYADPIERIKEIKRLVNEKVGNPVNLIDSNNDIGREYMNSLLDAMKKASGGQAGDASIAMARLEKAFQAVEEMIAGGGVTTIQPQAQAPTAEPKESAEEPASAPKIVVVKSPQSTPTPPPVVPPQSAPEPAPVVTPLKPIAPQSPSMSVPPVPQPSSSVPPKKGMVSVAKEKQLQELMQANKQQEAVAKHKQEETAISAMDPVMTPAVTNGLQHLLSEWSLFKSSGIFGTGPSGMEHALYKKLAPLTMAAVIAGRFEGANAEIKQSITDYMNGWRYEEGIVHEHGETFEHYLRRVIKHILDGQNPKSTA